MPSRRSWWWRTIETSSSSPSAFDQLGPVHGVALDDVELLVGQPPRLAQDRRRRVDLADVVEGCGGPARGPRVSLSRPMRLAIIQQWRATRREWPCVYGSVASSAALSFSSASAWAPVAWPSPSAAWVSASEPRTALCRGQPPLAVAAADEPPQQQLSEQQIARAGAFFPVRGAHPRRGERRDEGDHERQQGRPDDAVAPKPPHECGRQDHDKRRRAHDPSDVSPKLDTSGPARGRLEGGSELLLLRLVASLGGLRRLTWTRTRAKLSLAYLPWNGWRPSRLADETSSFASPPRDGFAMSSAWICQALVRQPAVRG